MTPAAKKSRKPTLRIERGGFLAEITRSKSGMGYIYHYVIFQEGSAEILGWGQEASLKAARNCVVDYVEYRVNRGKTG